MDNFKKAGIYQGRLNKHKPFEGRMLTKLKDYYRIGLIFTSNALEGNSLTESETKVILEDGLTVGGKPLRDIYEAVGSAKSYDFMFELISKRQIAEEDILYMHELFYSQIDLINAGTYRREDVFISGSKYSVTAPYKIDREMKEFLEWFNKTEGTINPIEFAALAHLKFVFIHPFIDGNGRVARLILNLCLIRGKYNIAIIPPIVRSEYIDKLEKAHADTIPFIDFIAERVIESQKDMLRLLNESISLDESEM